MLRTPSRNGLQVLGRTGVARRSSVVAIQFADRVLLIGGNDQAAPTMLAEIDLEGWELAMQPPVDPMAGGPGPAPGRPPRRACSTPSARRPPDVAETLHAGPLRARRVRLDVDRRALAAMFAGLVFVTLSFLALSFLATGGQTAEASTPPTTPPTTTLPSDAGVGSANLELSFPDVTENSSNTVVIILLLTVISVAPSLLVLCTSFTRIVIVLSLTRNALGIPQIPPQQVIVGLSLLLSLFVMGPTLQTMNEVALKPSDGRRDHDVRRARTWRRFR